MLQLRFNPPAPYSYSPSHTLNGYGYVRMPMREQLLALDLALARAVWGNNRTISENLARAIAARYGIPIRAAKRLVHARVARHVSELAAEFGLDYVESLNLGAVVFNFLESFDPS